MAFPGAPPLGQLSFPPMPYQLLPPRGLGMSYPFSSPPGPFHGTFQGPQEPYSSPLGPLQRSFPRPRGPYPTPICPPFLPSFQAAPQTQKGLDQVAEVPEPSAKKCRKSRWEPTDEIDPKTFVDRKRLSEFQYVAFFPVWVNRKLVR